MTFTLCLMLAVLLSLGNNSEGRISPYNIKLRHPLHQSYSYQTFYFEQQVDHFGFVNQDTFKQRYLVADQFWNHDGGPIFFYTGNEGDITWFCNNTGFMWDIAPLFKALLVFAEHRYYGNSFPYGPESLNDTGKLNYLTSEQALADFVELVGYLKTTIPGAINSSVIAFGGSYGGMLAAWSRMKYPNTFNGALAASAPIWLFDGLGLCDGPFITITETFRMTVPNCPDNIFSSWATLDQAAATDEGRQFISNVFGLCAPLKTPDDLSNLKSWLSDVWFNLAMVNYPYPANFLEPLPAWPVKVACQPLAEELSGKLLIEGIAEAAHVYFNYSGQAKCINTSQSATKDLGDAGWDYQACTEMVMASCSGNGSMFEPSTWDFKNYSENCYKTYKVYPRPDWGASEYWGHSIQSASNIIFSNGLLDPWSSLGVLNSPSDTLIAIQIPYGAHHLDLRAADPNDTYDVMAARQQEVNLIRQWLDGMNF